ncbi:regulatory protein, luxR family [Actinokineospora iranica]|uniref:Regulatory protein, luxR family n=2 Tax=Actinokineospora iranica TaxID=1271860 RepID=A0A1G6S739_9PSEU|nr:regulatory protein, luxR family [Actinokineospora iranica]
MAAPLSETLERFSEILADVVAHRAVAMLTGDCARSPLMSHGAVEATSSEMASLARLVDVGRPWYGEAVVGGTARPVLAVASAPSGSAGALLAVLPEDGVAPTRAEQEVAQQLWDLATLHVVDLLTEAVPVHMAENWAAASARSKAVAELTDAHATTLTTLLVTLRSKSLDDAAARRTAIEVAVSALIELRSALDQDRATSEETAGEAFARLADTLGLLTRYSDVALDLTGPEAAQRSLPADVANAARATVRDAVVIMLEQGGVSRIRVTWNVEDTRLRVSVRDNGAGTLAADALPVLRLSDRLRALNGALEFDSPPDWGTTVTASLPLTPPEVPDANPLSSLNPREIDVLEQLSQGRRNRQIAAHLHISEHTVKFHVANILSKLEVTSRGEAAAVARAAGLPARVSLVRLPGDTRPGQHAI